ncbi:LOW QUALITY PROTEIN: hypothetical protein QTO34_000485 [Cnephaeus nilssonii]|uniref:Integrase catalytic domain-containing protein n=1 Tax=Cnephaeus nilssonii TaxID=3371016 RepID=A0AA40ICJ6_CNENI|nr:LOW QUALITY PROTEIN: hypothetical protein QTO34_000485 [Eptesicus nilssonii]
MQISMEQPLLPVKKPGTNDYRPVQDLRAVNEAVITLHSALPNPYTLLGLIPSEADWAKEQFTWTRLPQGFKNSPTLFSGALASDLSSQDRTWDNLLLVSSTRAQCWEGTRALLRLLTETGYQVSKKKAQICQKEVKFWITQGKQRLGTERKQAVCAIPVPSTRWQIPEFLGEAGFCQIWIPGFSDMARPLYEALRGEEKAPINWGLPDVTRDFNLFVHENSGVALGVLTQECGPWQRPVAYLSKQIDPVAPGWPLCLRALAATALLVKEADKLTLGQNLNVKVPHAVVTLMEARGQHWLTHARMTQYQWVLCENPQVRLEAVRTLNLATFLPITEGAPEHDCLEVLEEVYSSWPDLRDRPLSFLDEGKRRARYAVVSNFETTEAQALPEGWSAQRAELWALVRALELSKNKKANIYTDLHYAFATLHVTRKGKTQYQKETSLLTPQPSWLLKNKQHRHGSCWPLNYLNLQNTLLRKRNGPRKKGAKEQGRLRCLLCAQNNAKQGVQRCGQAPFENLEVDFTEIGPSRGNKYLLVFVCTFSGWVEAYPTHTEKAREVTKTLLKDIIPRFGMPLTIGSNNGPPFVAEIVQQVAKALGIKWNLHTAYRPQSSGKVECMNRTLKQTMAKLCQETTLPWTDILPLVFLRVCCAPRARVVSLPLKFYKKSRNNYKDLEKLSLRSTGTAVHPYKPGDQVWVKDWKKKPLKPTWKGPYPVILTTPTALKVTGLNTWIHHSRVKAEHQPSDIQSEWKVTSDQKYPLQSTLKKTADLAEQPAPRNSDNTLLNSP